MWRLKLPHDESFGFILSVKLKSWSGNMEDITLANAKIARYELVVADTLISIRGGVF